MTTISLSHDVEINFNISYNTTKNIVENINTKQNLFYFSHGYNKARNNFSLIEAHYKKNESILSPANRSYDLLEFINLNKIESMRNFKLNWNGNNGLPFSNDAIDMFLNIINKLMKQPEIAPTGRESLLMQYELEDDSYLAFEVFKDRVTELLIPQNDYDKAITTEISDDFINKMNNSLEKFYEPKLY